MCCSLTLPELQPHAKADGLVELLSQSRVARVLKGLQQEHHHTAQHSMTCHTAQHFPQKSREGRSAMQCAPGAITSAVRTCCARLCMACKAPQGGGIYSGPRSQHIILSGRNESPTRKSNMHSLLARPPLPPVLGRPLVLLLLYHPAPRHMPCP